MCNRYANKSTLSELRRLMELIDLDLVATSATANLGQEDVYPDQDASVLRPSSEGRIELAKLRWGFPEAKPKARPITNIRNLNSSWWRNVNGQFLMQPEYRCLVPLTAFAEPPFKPTWFGKPDQSTAFFAGIWRPWHGERLMPVEGKKRRQRIEGDYELFSFLTTEANSIVRPVHEKAMPVILTEPDEWKEWLSGGKETLNLQRPLSNEQLCILDAV